MGDGYMIKHSDSELYCAVANAGEFEGKAVVLSTVPTVWTFAYIDADMNTVAYVQFNTVNTSVPIYD